MCLLEVPLLVLVVIFKIVIVCETRKQYKRDLANRTQHCTL